MILDIMTFTLIHAVVSERGVRVPAAIPNR
jgi:hypothetical protein